MASNPTLDTVGTSHQELLSPAEFRVRIDKVIADIYRERIEEAGVVDELFAELISEMARFIGRGGKRMRPYLCYLGYVGSGGTNIDEIVRVAVSQELYHNAWLIHDDIIDRDTTRYGGKNIIGAYLQKLETRGVADARHLAEAAALIAGSVTMAFAIDEILKSNFSPEHKVAATRLQQRLIVDLAGGEMLDVFLPTLTDDQITTKRLLAVSEYKTATYSFQSPLQIGAILAGAGQAEIDAITPYAIASGIAFQLTDDVLGIFGHEESTGKSNLSDIREGKRTLLVLESQRRATPQDVLRLTTILGNTRATAVELESVREIMKRSGAYDIVATIIHDYVVRAKTSLTATSLTAQVKASLDEIVGGLIGRQA